MSESSIRVRPYQPIPISSTMSQLSGPGSPLVASTYSTQLKGFQRTISEGHNWPPRKGESFEDRGGDFFTQKKYTLCDIPVWGTWTPYYTMSMSGNTFLVMPDDVAVGVYGVAWPTSPTTPSSLDQYGATAISRCAPGSPPAQGATAILETVKDGLPSALGSIIARNKSGKLSKEAADEFLNSSFGWKPLISDVLSFARSVRDSESILSQLERDAGRVVRRKYRFPTESSKGEDVLVKSNFKALVANSSLANSGSGLLYKRRETYVQRWFSGSFTYYLPSEYYSRKKVRSLAARANELLGLELTPEVLWDLAPWSWAVDWFSNTGDVLNNLQRFSSGNLVMPYGYMMEHSINKDVYQATRLGIRANDRSAAQVVVVETKMRRQANPFGFGVSFGSLSAFQTAIVAALGLSRT